MQRLQSIKIFRLLFVGLIFYTISSQAQLSCVDIFKNQKFTAAYLLGHADSKWFEPSTIKSMLDFLNQEVPVGLNLKLRVNLVIDLKKSTREDTRNAILRVLSEYATEYKENGTYKKDIGGIRINENDTIVVSIPLSNSKFLLSQLARDYHSAVEHIDLRLPLDPGRALKLSAQPQNSLPAVQVPLELKEELAQSRNLQWPKTFKIRNPVDSQYLPHITNATHEGLKALLKLAKNEEALPDQNDHAFRSRPPEDIGLITVRPTEIILDTEYGIPVKMKLQISVRNTDPLSSQVYPYELQLVRSTDGGAWTFLNFIQ